MAENSSEQEPCCEASALRRIRQIALPGGMKVGVVNLDNILKEVAALNLSDAGVVRMKLLEKVQDCNYVPDGAKNAYATALYTEYRKQPSK